MVVYGLFLATLKRRPLKQSIGATLFLLKNRRFFNKNNVAPKSLFRAQRGTARKPYKMQFVQ